MKQNPKEAVSNIQQNCSQDDNLIKTNSIRISTDYQAMYQNPSFLSVLIDAFGDGIAVLDENGLFEFGNNTFFLSIGWPREEVIGQHFLKLVPSRDYCSVMKCWDNARHGQSGKYELSMPSQNGKEKHFLLLYNPVRYEDKQRVIVCITEVAEKKDLECEFQLQKQQLEILLQQQSQQLRSTERLYQDLLENAGHPVFIIDEDGQVIYVNFCGAEYWKSTPDDLIGKTVFELFGPEQGELNMKDVRTVMTNNKPMSTEHEINFWGRMLWFDVRIWPLKTDAGKKRQVLLFAIDTTEKVLAQRALAESEERFRLLTEAAFEGIIIHENGIIVDCNDVFAGLSGYSRQELIGRESLVFVHPEDKNKMFGIKDRNYQDPYEIRYFSKNGTEGILEIRGRPVTWHGRQLRMASVRDITEKKKQEQTLAESEKRYRLLTEAAFEGVIIHDGGVVVDCNEVFVALSGYSRQELIGREGLVFIHPEDHNKMFGIKDRSYQGVYEVRYITKDGVEGVVEIQGRPIVWQGRQLRMASIRDITAQKKQQQALAESEERFRLLTEAAFEAIFIHDNGIIVEANDNFARILGYQSGKEVIGVDAFSALTPEDKKFSRKMFETGYEGDFEIKAYNSKGELRHFLAHSRFINWNSKKLRVAACRDITEQSKHQQAVAESEQRFRCMAESAFEGIVIHDKGVIVDCNQVYADLLGYSQRELIGRDGLGFIHPEDRNKMKGVADPNYQNAYEVRLIRRDGSQRIVENKGRPINWQGRQLRITSVRDVTEKRKMEKNLREYRLQVREMQRQVYASTVSLFFGHELSQPLTVLELFLGQAYDTFDQKGTCEQLREILEKCLFQIRQASEIIRKYRSFNASRAMEHPIQKIQVVPVIQQIISAMEDLSIQRNISLVADESLVGLPPVSFNPLMLEQMCVVFIQNSIEAAPPDIANQLIISGKVVKQGIELSFCDDCGGVPPESEQKIFDAFYTTKPGNMGMGLEIVQRFLMACGGSVKLQNNPGKGACFIVYIPVES